MQVLLASGGYRTEERVRLFREVVRAHLGGVSRLLFVPYALQDHEGYVRVILERGLDAGYEIDGIHHHSNPERAVREAEGIYVGGGNTFRLLHTLYQLHLLEPIQERVRTGIPYLGISAGSNIACPTIKTTNDMPIVLPPSFNALGLVPVQINPHYYTGSNWVKHGEEFVPHFGETRDDRIREFHEMNDTAVIGLFEAGILRFDGERMFLYVAPARVFRNGLPPHHAQPNDELTGLLS